jgi:glycosyltransferase involved in cell wall biosynthesis
MKILYYATAYHAKHGGSTHAKAFVEECLRHPLVTGIQVFPLSSSGATEKKKSGIKKFLKENSLLQMFFFWRRNRFHLVELEKQIKAFRPDVIHVRLDSNFLQIKKLKALFPGVIVSTEVNASPFDESFKHIAFREIYRRIEKRFLSKADLNFFVSDELRRKIMGNASELNRDFVVQNGVDLALFTRRNAVTRNEHVGKTLIYVGTIDGHKAIDELLRGFKIASDKYNNLRLLLVGDGPAKGEIESLARELQLDNLVTFTGWVRHEEIPSYLEHADIAIHHKANPYMSAIKIFEYMAMELPVIGPDIPSVTEIFREGENIVLTKADPLSIAAKIAYLMNDEELQQRIAKNGSALVRGHYTWAANADFIVRRIQERLELKKTDS